jgi:hypothetical protein
MDRWAREKRCSLSVVFIGKRNQAAKMGVGKAEANEIGKYRFHLGLDRGN